MIKCLSILAMLLVGGLLAHAGAAAGQNKSCRDHPRLVANCFDVHGRLSVYNGAPALRIWKAGTRRMLGISDQRFVESGFSNVPEYIKTQIDQDTALWGDYVVCPFTHSRPGEMQLVCIESVKNLVARKRK